MSNTIAIVLNCDTRPGWLGEESHVGKTGSGSLQGVRSYDFIFDLPHTIRKFFAGWPGEVKLIMCVDKHGDFTILHECELNILKDRGTVSKIVITPHDHARRAKWNDHLYLRSLREAADADYVCHLDQDVALFRNPESKVLERMKAALDSGEAKFFCQPTMYPDYPDYPSTRFFVCKRETLDFDELERSIDDTYRRSKWGEKHCPCFESVLGLVAANNEKILYPPYDPDDWVCFSWVKYYSSSFSTGTPGLLGKLNAMSYPEVQDFIKRGALCGPMDFIPPPLAL